jgi:hypothetical protein
VQRRNVRETYTIQYQSNYAFVEKVNLVSMCVYVWLSFIVEIMKMD